MEDSNLSQHPHSNKKGVHYALTALKEVESQRDQALSKVDELVEQLKVREAELVALRLRLNIAPLATATPVQPKTREGRDSWQRGNWLSCGGDLAAPENAFHDGQFQDAIRLLDRILTGCDAGDEVRLDATLLEAKALCEIGAHHEASVHMSHAKRLASQIGRGELHAKVSFHEALYYYLVEDYKTALLCFSAATGLDAHTHEIEAWKEKAQAVMAGCSKP